MNTHSAALVRFTKVMGRRPNNTQLFKFVNTKIHCSHDLYLSVPSALMSIRTLIADTRSEYQFSQQDIKLLNGYANLFFRERFDESFIDEICDVEYLLEAQLAPPGLVITHQT